MLLEDEGHADEEAGRYGEDDADDLVDGRACGRVAADTAGAVVEVVGIV